MLCILHIVTFFFFLGAADPLRLWPVWNFHHAPEDSQFVHGHAGGLEGAVFDIRMYLIMHRAALFALTWLAGVYGHPACEKDVGMLVMAV